MVYVDIDPVAVAHSRGLLSGNERTAVIQEDVRGPPAAVLLAALFHFVPAPDTHVDLISRLMRPFVSGSYLVLSHGTADGSPDLAKVGEIYNRAGIEGGPRSRDQVTALFDGYDLVPPGVVWAPEWHAEHVDDLAVNEPESSGVYVGVARKS